MQLFSLLGAALPLLALVHASPVTTPSCTTTITKLPTRIGIVVGALVTSTSSIDCHGCALEITTEAFPEATNLVDVDFKRRAATETDEPTTTSRPELITATVWETVCATSTN